MANSQTSSFMTQAHALLLKNLIFQKRRMKTNVSLIIFPILVCLLLFGFQLLVDRVLNKIPITCGCGCVKRNPNRVCEEEKCGFEFSDSQLIRFCDVPSPPRWPPLLQVPKQNESCSSSNDSCPIQVLLTGANPSFGQSLAKNFFRTGSFDMNSSDVVGALAELYLGSNTYPPTTHYLEPSFNSIGFGQVYNIQPQCLPNSTFLVPFQLGSITIQEVVTCLESLQLWRDSSSVMSEEIINGHKDGYLYDIASAYDFFNSNEKNFNVSIWYGTIGNRDDKGYMSVVRVARLVSVVSNAFLQYLRGTDYRVLFEFVKEMPKHAEAKMNMDIFAPLTPLLFTWVIMQLVPVILASLVYEKQQNLRLMMKMHGLGDGPYWMISYAYFFFLSLIYVFCLVVFGSIIGLKFFTVNSYGIQFVFYFVYINLQIAFAFLLSTMFCKVKVATVIGHIYVLGSGLLGAFLLKDFIEDGSFSRVYIVLLEIFPCFSLYRGLYEFGQYSSRNDGMLWNDLSTNGMSEVFVIMLLEWVVVLAVAYYLDQVVSAGSGVRKHPLFFLQKFLKKPSPFQWSRLHGQGSEVSGLTEKLDVSSERKKVEQLLREPHTDYAIICDNLQKVYPGEDGNPEKFAVKGLSLALAQGECFGMLGPNGAGKTSSINMMIGLMSPSSGTAYVNGFDIRKDMDKIYYSMGVCPQYDLLWETLTGREHLLFYGRLKNLTGAALEQTVEESLKGVNLFHGNVGDKQAGKYSGGMKRRLSVAISLIGNPKVVYMDEPSTGLDPASRNLLWDVVRCAKEKCAIILTTHSMEEAEVLCDRLGIFVDGSLQCVGSPTELKGRYGGTYVWTMTTDSSEDKEVERFIQQQFPAANKVYHISGTQKFELQKKEVRIADVFEAVQKAKGKFKIHAWGLADTTLEDVFIKVASGAQAFNNLS